MDVKIGDGGGHQVVRKLGKFLAVASTNPGPLLAAMAVLCTRPPTSLLSFSMDGTAFNGR